MPGLQSARNRTRAAAGAAGAAAVARATAAAAEGCMGGCRRVPRSGSQRLPCTLQGAGKGPASASSLGCSHRCTRRPPGRIWRGWRRQWRRRRERWKIITAGARGASTTAEPAAVAEPAAAETATAQLAQPPPLPVRGSRCRGCDTPRRDAPDNAALGANASCLKCLGKIAQQRRRVVGRPQCYIARNSCSRPGCRL